MYENGFQIEYEICLSLFLSSCYHQYHCLLRYQQLVCPPHLHLKQKKRDYGTKQRKRFIHSTNIATYPKFDCLIYWLIWNLMFFLNLTNQNLDDRTFYQKQERYSAQAKNNLIQLKTLKKISTTTVHFDIILVKKVENWKDLVKIIIFLHFRWFNSTR